MRGARGYRLQRLGGHCIDTHIVDAARRARTWRIEQSVQALLDETSAPLRHRLRRDPLARSLHLIVHAVRAGQNDARSQGQRLRRLATQRQCHELFASDSLNISCAFGLPLITALVVFTPYTTEQAADKISSMNF